jgi:outer membrane lipoprotein-sorting protein
MWLTTTVFFSLTVGGGPGADSACPEMEKLRQSYQEKWYLSLDFLQLTYSEIFETVDSLRGQLWAGREGRFRLVMPGQTLVSNGILYWSYSDENKQVLVDSVVGRGDWNPVVLLYDPEKVYTCQNQIDLPESIEFELRAIDSQTVPSEFSLQVTKSDYIPQKIVYYDDNNSRIEVWLSNFSRPDKLPDSLFIFRAPEGVEVIEMP